MDAKYTKHDHIAGSMQGITRRGSRATAVILPSLRLVVLPCHPSFVHAVELAVESEVIKTNSFFSYSLRRAVNSFSLERVYRTSTLTFLGESDAVNIPSQSKGTGSPCVLAPSFQPLQLISLHSSYFYAVLCSSSSSSNIMSSSSDPPKQLTFPQTSN